MSHDEGGDHPRLVASRLLRLFKWTIGIAAGLLVAGFVFSTVEYLQDVSDRNK